MTIQTFPCFHDRRQLRSFIVTASLVFLLSAIDRRLNAQETDTSNVIPADDARDPCSNRVFWVSTGDVSAPGRVSIGLMGAPYLIVAGIYQATVVQAGYAPEIFCSAICPGPQATGRQG